MARSRSRSPKNTSEPVKLHISYLPIDVTHNQIQALFEQWGGKVSDIRIIKKDSKGNNLKDSCYGFVSMENKQQADIVIENLTQKGWKVEYSRDQNLGAESSSKIPKIKKTFSKRKPALKKSSPSPPPREPSPPPSPPSPPPSQASLQANLQATWIMLTSNQGNGALEPELLKQAIIGNHQNAFQGEGQTGYCVREIWVGNIVPSTEKRSLYDAFKLFGKVEGIEMFSSKSFCFVKYRTVNAACRAYEQGQGILVDGRPVKVAFADPTRRFDIMGNSTLREPPGFDPVADDNFKNLYIGFTPGTTLPPESTFRKVFSQYGPIKIIHLKQVDPPGRPYAFIDFVKGKDAAKCRQDLYLNDEGGQKRAQLGDPNIEVSFKNSYTPRPFKKAGASFQDLAQRSQQNEVTDIVSSLMQNGTQVLDKFKPPFMQTQHNPMMLNPLMVSLVPSQFLTQGMTNQFQPQLQSTSSHEALQSISQGQQQQSQKIIKQPSPVLMEQQSNIGNVVWSGFMTRSKNHRVGVDATLIQGDYEALSQVYHINISHRVKYEDATKIQPKALLTLEASDQTQLATFAEYIKYLSDKERSGFVQMKNNSALYLFPSCEVSKKYCASLQPFQLLAMLVVA